MSNKDQQNNSAIEKIAKLVESGEGPRELVEIYRSMNRNKFKTFIAGYAFARQNQISVKRGETSIFLGRELLPFL